MLEFIKSEHMHKGRCRPILLIRELSTIPTTTIHLTYEDVIELLEAIKVFLVGEDEEK